MDYFEMLTELYEMVHEEELFNDDCGHEDPTGAETANMKAADFCAVCFVTNLYEHCSEGEIEFLEETTELQRETIISLWEQYANS